MAVAAALLDGEVLIDQFSEKRINSDDVWDLIDRTKTHHEKAYDQLPVDERLTKPGPRACMSPASGFPAFRQRRC
jgi:2-methylcitrate dehydratase PrpD